MIFDVRNVNENLLNILTHSAREYFEKLAVKKQKATKTQL